MAELWENVETSFDHKQETRTFMERKRKPVAEFNDGEWMCEFAFIVDITTHMNELNTHLQGKSQLVNSMFGHIKAVEIKLHLWESQLKNKNIIYFLTVLKCNVWDFQKYVSIILA
jgi:hypothetical protein